MDQSRDAELAPAQASQSGPSLAGFVVCCPSPSQFDPAQPHQAPLLPAHAAFPVQEQTWLSASNLQADGHGPAVNSCPGNPRSLLHQPPAGSRLGRRPGHLTLGICPQPEAFSCKQIHAPVWYTRTALPVNGHFWRGATKPEERIPPVGKSWTCGPRRRSAPCTHTRTHARTHAPVDRKGAACITRRCQQMDEQQR